MVKLVVACRCRWPLPVYFDFLVDYFAWNSSLEYSKWYHIIEVWFRWLWKAYYVRCCILGQRNSVKVVKRGACLDFGGSSAILAVTGWCIYGLRACSDTCKQYMLVNKYSSRSLSASIGLVSEATNNTILCLTLPGFSFVCFEIWPS